ncbi:hypothetical protein INT48_003244 [Thamnidium elegans]|uniref:Uncharacterized protein n=1 Tax=Thamnidium elegans TaxID=101142 RepID=A0A8H7W1G4_9FUNG|nr:hypothetical protein INT48_003244 [Thamnidium elegans]
MTLDKNKFAADILPQSEMMTIFLSMDLCCARVSDESVKFLHIKPSDLDHRSFYEFIETDSTDKLSRIHRLLLDNSHSTQVPQHQPISFSTTASSDLFLTSSPAQLFQIANGSQTLTETLKFKVSGKALSCKFYLGGGFGADLFVPSTLDHLYMVCIVSELNTNTSDIVKPAPINMSFRQTEQLQLDSILDATNLMSMVNFGVKNVYTFFSNFIFCQYNHSLPTDDEAVQLVNRLCAVSPPTPPEEHSTNTGYYSSSESSMDTFIDLNTPMMSKPLCQSKPNQFNSLLENTLLMFSPQKNYWDYTP